MEYRGKTILINGSSSSGKSTFANILKCSSHYTHFGIDTLWSHLIPPFFCNQMEGGFRLIKNHNGIVELFMGKFAESILEKYVKIIKVLAQNIDVVCDEIVKSQNHMNLILSTLDLDYTYFIKFNCSDKELVRREKSRGDRIHGLAVSEKREIDNLKFTYDLVFDTTNLNSLKALNSIEQLIKMPARALKKMATNRTSPNIDKGYV